MRFRSVGNSKKNWFVGVRCCSVDNQEKQSNFGAHLVGDSTSPEEYYFKVEELTVKARMLCIEADEFHQRFALTRYEKAAAVYSRSVSVKLI